MSFTMIHTGNKVVIAIDMFTLKSFTLTYMVDIKSEIIHMGLTGEEQGSVATCGIPS